MSSSFKNVSYQITLNSSNVVPDTNNSKYIYKFPSTKNYKKAKIALGGCSLFYSWFNISTANNNNSFSYIFEDAVGPATFAVNIPDGYYSVDTLNLFLQSVMIANGHYLVDDAGNNVYYLTIIPNPTYYSIQLTAFPVPTSLPVGWSNPASLTFPAVATTPQFIIPATNIQNFFGLPADTYPDPSQATIYSIDSTTTPQVNVVSNVVILCSLVRNQISVPATVLQQFNAGGVPFGGLVSVQPNFEVFLDVQEGNYGQIEIEFVDQNFNAIEFQDASGTIIQLLVIEEKE